MKKCSNFFIAHLICHNKFAVFAKYFFAKTTNIS